MIAASLGPQPPDVRVKRSVCSSGALDVPLSRARRADLNSLGAIDRSGRKLALTMIAAGALPFLGGILLHESWLASSAMDHVSCPIRSLTKIPCPSCGATTAFVALASGELDLRRHNFVVVGYAAALSIAGVYLYSAPRRVRDGLAATLTGQARRLRSRPLTTAILTTIVALPAWFCALRAVGRTDATLARRAPLGGGQPFV
jgi:hypothetical protein